MKKILPLLLVITFLSGCGYKLGTMTIGGIKTISIEAISNETGKNFIEESYVSSALVREFNRDGTIKVVNENISDASMKITLSEYIQEAQAFSVSDVGTSFRIIILAKVTASDNNNDKIYSNTIQGEAFYNIGLDQSEIERVTTKKAIDDLTTEIVRAAIDGGW